MAIAALPIRGTNAAWPAPKGAKAKWGTRTQGRIRKRCWLAMAPSQLPALRRTGQPMNRSRTATFQAAAPKTMTANSRPRHIPGQVLHVLPDRAVEARDSDIGPAVGATRRRAPGLSTGSKRHRLQRPAGGPVMGVPAAGRESRLGKPGGAWAQGRRVRLWGGGSWTSPRACSFKSIVRAAMSLSRPAPLRQFHSWHR